MPLDAARLERLKKELLEEKEKILARMAHRRESPKENIGLGNHMADDATEAFEQEKWLSLEKQERDTLAKIEKALRKMDEGTYGICERCGGPIDYARLKAIPYATLCLRCQKKIEQGV